MVPTFLPWFPGLHCGSWSSTVVLGLYHGPWGSTMVPGALPWFPGALPWPPGLYRGPRGSTMVVYFLLELSDAVLTPAANIFPQ